MKLEGFDDLLDDVEDLERDLAAPLSFYQEYRADYWMQARAIAERILKAAQPQDANPHDWQRKIDRIADRITTELLTGGNGVVFAFAPSTEQADGARPEKQVMTFSDIKEWVQAGIDGVPGGKRITAIDKKVMADKGVDGVASVVMKAYYSTKPEARYERLRRHIQRYFLGARPVQEDPIVDLVVAALTEHFSVVIPRDLERYAAKLCRDFG